MNLITKNLTKEILKNKVFLILLFIVTTAVFFMFFFLRFSIDANMEFLKSLSVLSQNQQNYMNALKSNTRLATMFFLIITSVAALLFVMFYFRFFSSAKKQIGICKALGTRNLKLQLYFALFAVIFSIGAVLIGMLAGYFASSIMINANTRSYNVTGLSKGLSTQSIIFGIAVPILVFALTLFLCGFNLYKKENGDLLSENKQSAKPSRLLNFADKCVKRLPIKNKAPLRLAIKRPLSISLIITACMVFTVFLVLGWSITKGSEAEYRTQTQGHEYKYEFIFKEIQSENADKNGLYYLSQNGFIHSVNGEVYEYEEDDEKIKQTISGMEENDTLYSLKTAFKEDLGLPENGFCYISIALAEIRGIKKGDTIIINTEKGNSNDNITFNNTLTLTVQDIAYNAKKNTIIVSKAYLCGLLDIDAQSYSGVLSKENIYPDITALYDADNEWTQDMVIDTETREDILDRARNSTGKGAIINQIIGLGSSIAVIFLALFIAFQDSVKDMLIMDNLGYRKREIRKLLINIFLPILILSFIITAAPAALLAKGIQASTARMTGDYSPFIPLTEALLVLLVGFAIIVAVYWLVQLVFSLGIKRIIKKKGILEYTNSL